ncbi:MAG: hypothetical protein HY220_00075 [Candidatus Sungbacteria bacterium]|uniref:Adenine phosphoribosyltransferase n=1 Tax=Candidatus Sungiibacteriota bacterium TaxID=2750080 RepID=A0A9D6LQV3_9BACT|nr:hypothetical protein [Candidatus Sungbacteria bacterium]
MTYREVFHKPHTMLAVVHIKTLAQALENVALAEGEGANGVFLIDHATRANLITIYRTVREKFPTLWAGANWLDRSADEALAAIPDDVLGLWTDNAGINEDPEDPAATARANWRICQERRWPGLYFGGFAFKYQQPVENLAPLAELAAKYMDVVTTSGLATGEAPDVEKIQTIRHAIGPETTLAIASGMSSENVGAYLGLADCFLVATSISGSFFNLDAAKVRAFAKALA